MVLLPCKNILTIIYNTQWYPKSSEHPGMLSIPFLALPQVMHEGRWPWKLAQLSLCQATYFSAMSSLLYLPILLCEFTICGQCKDCIVFRVMHQL